MISVSSHAAQLRGVVRNGTTGAPAASQQVILIQLQGGMEPVATTQSDAQGRYQFDRPDLGAAPMLVRVVYRGVNYHQNVPPGRDTADIEIFEPTATSSDLQVSNRVIAVQPNGPVLLLGEEFSVHNHAKPPATFFRDQGTFEFLVPEGATLSNVSAAGPAGMHLVQGTISKGANRYAIAFPFRPGPNAVRASFELPYPVSRATVRISSPYAAQSVLVVAPPTMQIDGAGFRPSGSEQGWNVFARDAVPAGAAIEFTVSGTAPPPSAAPSDMPGQGSSAASAAPAGAVVQAVPARLDSLKWILIPGFAALFALGAFFLWRKPHSVAVASASADLDRQVRGSLDEIKDALFRLELRRQAGTISEAEYAGERGRAEKLLRDLLRG